ncbi:MAG: arylsulfatase [Pirellulales bacterium]|nr:arylsulfatase [Pirellulales bacterium]
MKGPTMKDTAVLRKLLFPAAVALIVWPAGRLPAATPPSVVVILSDDQGWGDLSLHGNQNLSTPHVDSLAADGASFGRFFVCPVCSPTRAEFLTGRYHPRSGVHSTSAGGERMDLDETTIAETFRAAGYATAAFGKWHNGMQYPYHPNGRGFDEYYGFCSGHWGNYYSPMLEHNGRLVRGNGFVIDDFTDRAIRFIEQHRDRPFFVYLPLNTPHSPMQVPDRWWGRFKDKKLPMHHREPERETVPHVRAALAMCENIDWNVGRLLRRLDELGLARNTIVVYFCDNGPNGFRWNGGMKGRKGSTDEGGVRSPLLIRWPGTIEGGRKIPQIAAAIDLLPTLADLAGVEPIGKKPLDGVSLKRLLLEDSPRWPERMIFSHWNKRVSVRTQQHRLDHQGKLYDMVADPGQYRDVAGQQPQVAARLRQAAADFRQQVLGEYEPDDRPFLVGHPDYRYTQLPARDAKTHGNIQRSNRFPNCSYFTNWTSLDDRITWDAEVLAGGTYEVEVYYTCPPSDVGSIIELSFGRSRLRGRIVEPHDPPQHGREHDRVERMESYVKDFKPLKLGAIRLEAGRGELTLRAVEMPGSQVMDFRLLMLSRARDAGEVSHR